MRGLHKPLVINQPMGIWDINVCLDFDPLQSEHVQKVCNAKFVRVTSISLWKTKTVPFSWWNPVFWRGFNPFLASKIPEEGETRSSEV